MYSFRLYVDGALAGSGVMVGPNMPLQLNGTIYIGQEQDALAGGLDAMQSTSAHIAQVPPSTGLCDLCAVLMCFGPA